VEMFVKVEKHYGPVKEPRCIQFRKPEFTLELARYLQPIEREFVRYYTQDVPNGEPRRKFYTTKGMTTQEKAALINRLWKPGMWAFCGDQSRFDAHKREKALKATDKWYKAHYPGDRYLEWLLKLRSGTKGYSYFGRKYKQRESCVCSGDYDTSLGNTWTIDALFHDLDVEFIVGEGDDCLFIGTPSQVTRAAEEARRVAEERGFSFDGFIAVDPAEAEYCSAKVGAHDLIRVYPKPLHTEGWSVHTYPDQFKAAVSKQMAMSALYRYQGQAVYGQFALWLWERAQHLRVKKTGMWYEGAWGVHPHGDL